MSLVGADPGGEPWFSRTQAQMLAENILIDANGISCANDAPAGRATVYAYKSTGGSIWMAKGNFGNLAQITVGWAEYVSVATFAANTIIFTNTDVTTHQIELVIADTAGHIALKLNGSAVIAGSTSTLTLPGTGWHYYEISIVLSTTTTGSVVVKIDGTTYINVSSVKTSGTANAYSNRFYLQPIVPNTATWYRDLYWRNDTTMLGDLTVNVLYAASNGPTQNFAASAGTAVACVQDGITHSGTWPNDADYIFDATTGDISDFHFQTVTVPGGGSILGAIHCTRMSKDDVGARSAQQYSKSSSTVHTSASIVLGSSPAYFFDVMETDPATSAAWTQTNLNASTHGVKNV